MYSPRSKGSTLVLVLACLAIVALLVGFLVLNFGQLLSTHKEAQTAIDAAALQASKDIGKIVITSKDGSNFGNVALLDDNFITDGCKPKVDVAKPPVVSINTIMATVRLDALIANELKNKSMLVLAMEDLARAQQDSKLLRDKIVDAVEKGTEVKDIDGKVIKIQSDVNKAYDDNAIRMGNAARKGDVKIVPGYVVAGSMQTNVPTPVPANKAQVTGSFYEASKPIATKVLGQDLQFMFSAVGAQPSLIANDQFVPYAKQSATEYLVPTAIQVTADETVQGGAPTSYGQSEQDKKRTRPEGKLTGVSTAIVGGQRQSFVSGSLVIGFPQTIPPSAMGANFSTIKNIMNMSQIRPTGQPNMLNANANLGGASPYDNGWNKSSPGVWLQAQGGNVPSDPKGKMVSNPPTTSFTGFRGRTSDDPSVVLSFLVYDWLRHLYLRPNIDSVVSALETTLANPSTKSSVLIENDKFASNLGFMAPAYANHEANYPTTFALVKVPLDGVGDPRDQRNFEQDPEAYRRQIANVFNYVPASPTLPDASLMVSMDNEGRVVTTNGEPIKVLTDFWQRVVDSNNVAAQTMKNAITAEKQKMEEAQVADDNIRKLEIKKKRTADPAQLQEIQRQIDHETDVRDQASLKVSRAEAVGANAMFMINMSLGILNDRKAITAGGVTPVGENFEIAKGILCPASHTATVAEIISDQAIPTGQTGPASGNNWAAPLVDNLPQIQLYVGTGQKVSQSIPSNQPNDLWMQPVLAATSIPPNTIFMLTVKGDVSSSSGGGTIAIEPLNNLPANWSPDILEGQFEYQNTASLVTQPTGSAQLVWNCIARDNAANEKGNYFGGSPATTGSYPLACEWTLRCPAPVAVTPPSTPPTPPPPSTTPTPPPPVPPPPPRSTTPTCFNANVISVHSLGDPNRLGSDLSNVNPQADSSGNVTYKYNGQTMHFFTDFNTWYAQLEATKNVPEWPGIYDGYGGKHAWALFSKSDWQNWWDNYANKGTPISTQSGSTADQKRWSAYRQVLFWTQTGSACAQLYRWSS